MIKLSLRLRMPSSKVKDPDLKSFIDKTLPVLRQHQQHIHEIESASRSGKA
jgi:predicted outer membrane protein